MGAAAHPASDSSPYVSSVASLALAHFRNYQQLKFEFNESPIVLTGANGAGKTNLLEAVSMLAPGRGLRRSANSEIQGEGTPNCWAIAAVVRHADREVAIGTGLESLLAEKRVIKIDGKIVRSQAELGKVFSALWLTPQMDTLFLDGDGARRKFLDRLTAGFDPEHTDRVAAYEYYVRERNTLLQSGNRDAHWLSSLEHQMAERAVAIVVSRHLTVENLNRSIESAETGFPKAGISAGGFLEELLAEGQSAVDIEHNYRDRLADLRGTDTESGRCQLGAHRSAIKVIHSEKGREAAECSTGEQKAMLLSIILGQARALRDWQGRIPVLLLDEVVAHLDRTRRARLYEALSELGSQCWLTGTDEALFEGLKTPFQSFHIEDGKLLQKV